MKPSKWNRITVSFTCRGLAAGRDGRTITDSGLYRCVIVRYRIFGGALCGLFPKPFRRPIYRTESWALCAEDPGISSVSGTSMCVSVVGPTALKDWLPRLMAAA